MNEDDFLTRMIQAKHYAVEFIEEAFDSLDEFDLSDIEDSFAKLNAIRANVIPKDMQDLVMKEIKKVVLDLIEEAEVRGYSMDDIHDELDLVKKSVMKPAQAKTPSQGSKDILWSCKKPGTKEPDI